MIDLYLFFLQYTRDSKIALHCISYISGNEIPNLQPRWPNIGLCSCNSPILELISLLDKFKAFDKSLISFSFFGKNSWRGGSKSLIVTGKPFIILNISIKSFFWWGKSFVSALFLSCFVFDSIISLTDKILSSSKNMCSVLQSPTPSAPKSLATFVSNGVSELALIFSFLNLSAQLINFEKSLDISGLTVDTFPKIILPVDPSIVITSPSLTFKLVVLKVFSS